MSKEEISMSLNQPFLQPCRNKRKRAPKVKYPNPNCRHPNVLCAAKRDKGRKLLVKGGGGTVAVDEILNKKYVALFLVDLKNENPLPFLQPLIRVYQDLLKKHPGKFEIVFVADFPSPGADDDALSRHKLNKTLFELHLSRMPWPALPFDDHSKWRQHISLRYPEGQFFHDFKFMMIFDPTSRCVDPDSLESLLLYGSDMFPFTPLKVKQLESHYENTTILMQPFSAKNLLLSSNRDYLITGLSTKLPISGLGLSEKVVGLLFYHGYHHSAQEERHRLFMDKLHTYYLLSKGNFVVVFINLEFERGCQSPEELHAYLQKYPWLLALPFEDHRIRPLAYTMDMKFSLHCGNSLVILDNDVIDLYGYNVIEEYGFDAYPFTRNKVIELEMKNLADGLKLADVLGATFCTQSGTPEEKHVSSLQNRKVLLYNNTYGLYMEKLLALEENDKLLSIVIFSHENDRDYITLLSTMPKNWLAIRTRNVKCWMYNKFSLFLFGNFMTFNESGNFLTMGWLESIPTNVPTDFPFISHDSFSEEFRLDFINKKEWRDEVKRTRR